MYNLCGFQYLNTFAIVTLLVNANKAYFTNTEFPNLSMTLSSPRKTSDGENLITLLD